MAMYTRLWGFILHVHHVVNVFCFFQGTSAEQDNRFSNKHKKLLKQLKFAECLDKKVHTTVMSTPIVVLFTKSFNKTYQTHLVVA